MQNLQKFAILVLVRTPQAQQGDEQDQPYEVSIWPEAQIPGFRRDPQVRAKEVTGATAAIPILALAAFEVVQGIRIQGQLLSTDQADH